MTAPAGSEGRGGWGIDQRGGEHSGLLVGAGVGTIPDAPGARLPPVHVDIQGVDVPAVGVGEDLMPLALSTHGESCAAGGTSAGTGVV